MVYILFYDCDCFFKIAFHTESIRRYYYLGFYFNVIVDDRHYTVQ